MTTPYIQKLLPLCQDMLSTAAAMSDAAAVEQLKIGNKKVLVHRLSAHIDAVDEQLDYRGLLGREQLAPHPGERATPAGCYRGVSASYVEIDFLD